MVRDCLQTHSTIWERPFLPGVLLRFPQAPQSLLQSPEETPRKKSLPHIGKAVCRQSLRFRLLGTLAICGCIVAFALQLPGEKTYFIPFDEAQVQDQYSPKDLINFYQRLKKKKWRLVRHLYSSSLAGRKKRQKHTRIPKIIHQIWLEGPIPAEIRSIQASWTKLHPDWEYHLWTKEEVAFLYLQNRGYYDETDSLKIGNSPV